MIRGPRVHIIGGPDASPADEGMDDAPSAGEPEVAEWVQVVARRQPNANGRLPGR